MSELNHLNCPFTWEMEKLCRTPDSLINRNDGYAYDDSDRDDNCIPLVQLLYTVMKAYEYAESDCLEKAIKEIDDSQNLFHGLRKEIPNGLSIKAVSHVIKASKCFILKKMDKTDDIKRILKNIPSCKKRSELSTLHGCQSVIWHFYKFAGNEEAADHALTAIKLNPTNGLWFFFLAKSLRRMRRYVNLRTKPSTQERAAFTTAYGLLKDPFVGIYCAQMYRELQDRKEAQVMYNAIFDMKPNSCTVNLKLALGFIRCKEADKARQCLDYVEARMPNNSTYLCYKGIYLDKCLKDHKGALECFESAGSLLNFVADLSYLELKLRVTAGMYNPMPYLEIMLKRYEELGGYRVQVILLNMGTYYNHSKVDAKNACKYYLQAIEIDPRCKTLRDFYSDISKTKFSIFGALSKIIIPALKRQQDIDEEIPEMIKKAEEYRKLYGTENCKLVQQQMKKLRFQNRKDVRAKTEKF